ncbi:cell envelope integrity protein TolA [Limnohabitans sp. Hippo4]|jgi:colicin import membrane protein|uniref:cell envelope integrity protein TolA n=1 Tax=Limnohabitans sp. Hippo4 TaxID=1826167 RepID=UPI000D3C5069|nr:cell envelope integrity protein TolA [Limnohabitans sp. Hippo4]PUE36489.1 protein TolA [Limnohabitans sp. Hippo4]
MNATAYNEFAPPPVGGFGRSLSFALFMHLLLLAALTWGIQWKTEPNTLSASAELWSAVPAEAAPAAIEPEPTPPEPVKPPEPVQKAEPKPEPKPVPAPPKVNAAAEREAADIALKKEKEKKKLEEKKAADLEKKKKLEKEKLDKEKEKAKEKEKEKAKELEKKKKEEALKKEEAAAKAKEDAKKAAAEEKRAAALRSENLKRMQGMAGATGDENAKGTALKSSGPSASYAGRIRARIKPNITFTDDVAGNPKAEVEVKTSPDGTILSRKLLSSSGNKAWDEAVLKAIDKTAVLPRDEDGRVPPVLEISFRPKD